MTIVGATSGDTGSAAIEACAGRDRIDIAILHPHGRTSEVQRRQMTTVAAPNVANIAVEGTFDDCQDLVKAMFADAPFRQEMQLSAVNSINWARIAAQVPYYVAAALALGAPDREVAFSVPTGNFGNVLAAWAARRMGLPVARLIVGSNRNDILARFLASNDMSIATVEPSLSPSMDIQVSSNFERLLFELLERDAVATAAAMAEFRRTGKMAVPDAAWHRCRTVFHGFRLDDAGTEAEIARLHEAGGYLADPHTAIGIAAARGQSAARMACRRRDGDGASGEVPRRDRARHRSCGLPCRHGSPICSTGRSASPCCRTTLRRSRRRCARWHGATHEDPRRRTDRGGAAVRAADPGTARGLHDRRRRCRCVIATTSHSRTGPRRRCC